MRLITLILATTFHHINLRLIWPNPFSSPSFVPVCSVTDEPIDMREKNSSSIKKTYAKYCIIFNSLNVPTYKRNNFAAKFTKFSKSW